jgi:hypothetical protein
LDTKKCPYSWDDPSCHSGPSRSRSPAELRSRRIDAYHPRVPGEPARFAPQTAGLISVRLVLGTGEEVDQIALDLGLDTRQLSWGGDSALHAELDCPAGTWRVYPKRRMCLWISARPGYAPPSACTGERLKLASMVMALRARGIRFRDVCFYADDEWSAPLGPIAAVARVTSSEPSGISAVWSSIDRHPARIEIFADGALWAPSPSDAAWWVAEATSHDGAVP